MNADQLAATIARSQYGLLSRDDARRAGLSKTQLKDRVDNKGWVRQWRGLYLLPGAPRPTWRQDAMAGVLLGGPAARASHMTAGALHELCSPTLLPHVTVPRSASPRTRLMAAHRSDIPAVDRATVDGIACTTASRALVEAASLVDRASLDGMIDQALCANRATPVSVLAALDRAGRGWAGATRLRDAIRIWTEDIAPESPAEARFLRRLTEWGVTGAVTQHEIRDELDQFVARVDVALPDRRQAFEYDSDLFHGPRRFDADERRHARIEALGWTLHHVSKRDLLPSSTRVPDALARAERGGACLSASR